MNYSVQAITIGLAFFWIDGFLLINVLFSQKVYLKKVFSEFPYNSVVLKIFFLRKFSFVWQLNYNHMKNCRWDRGNIYLDLSKPVVLCKLFQLLAFGFSLNRRSTLIFAIHVIQLTKYRSNTRIMEINYFDHYY